MKKLLNTWIFVFFVCVCCDVMAQAVVGAGDGPEIVQVCQVNCSQQPPVDDPNWVCPEDGVSCTAGCYKNPYKAGDGTHTANCQACGIGTYIASPDHVIEACSDCKKPDNVANTVVNFVEDSADVLNPDVKACTEDGSNNSSCILTGRTLEYGCPWMVTCEDGYFWNGSQCSNCTKGYEGNGKTWTMVATGNKLSGIAANNRSERCIGIEYTISLQTNTSYAANITPVASGMPTSDEYKNKEIKYKYGDGLQGVSDPTTLPSSYFQPSTSYYTFLGYFKTANDSEDTTPIIDTSGKYKIDSDPDVEIESADLRDNNTLYARYEIHNTSVWYMDKKPQSWGNAPATKAEVVFTVKNPEADRKVKALPSNWYLDGKIFDYYDCYNVKTGAECQGKSKYIPGESLIFSDDLERVLIPHYYDCPKGHYCPKGVEEACPAGSTTNSTGQSQITSCVMKPTSSGTKFVDKYGTFYLPSNSDIPY